MMRLTDVRRGASELMAQSRGLAHPKQIDFADRGWQFWPGREDLSAAFMRVLASAQEGGSTISECWLTAARIDLEATSSWSEEWSKTAEINERRAGDSFSNGNVATACRNWLRAANYYQVAASQADIPPDLMSVAVEGMRRCAYSYVKSRSPAGEVVEIPWLADFSLQGYFLPSSLSGERPVVICIGEPGSRKEEILAKYASHAYEHGMSLLAVDLLGHDFTWNPERIAEAHAFDAAISHILDFLVGKSGVDEKRIAIVADDWSSSLVSRAVANDPRFAAAVCDGGIWELQEQAFLRWQATGVEDDHWLDRPNLVLRSIACPVLVTAGEVGWLQSDTLAEFGRRLNRSHPDATLRLFTREETAAAQSHSDNPTLANELIFDWIADRLRLRDKSLDRD
mgnify:CR=1 FL=1